MENDTATQGHLADDGHAEQAHYEPTVIETEHLPAAVRLRAFEDEHFGADCVRIHDKIERGVGSPFAAMSDEDKRQYAALEKVVVTEQKLADAHAAVVQAEADHKTAMAAAEPKSDADGK